MIEIDEEIIEGTCRLHPEVLKRSICMEECGELIQAISKRNRDKLTVNSKTFLPKDHWENEVEEIADVLLCIKMLMYYDGILPSDIQEWIDYKQKRQMIRDYEAFEKHNIIPTLCESYKLKCKEVYDDYKRNEEEAQKHVSNERKLGSESGQDATKASLRNLFEELLDEWFPETSDKKERPDSGTNVHVGLHDDAGIKMTKSTWADELLDNIGNIKITC